MTVYAYVLAAILSWTHAEDPADVEAAQALASVIDRVVVDPLPGWPSRHASALRLFAQAAWEVPLQPRWMRSFLALECPKPWSCDGGLAKGPWQMHGSQPTSLYDAAEKAYAMLRACPGAWTTRARAQEWTIRYLRAHPAR